MPRFLCPNCGRKIIVHTSARGRSGVCRGCGEKLKIPTRPSLIAHFKKRQELDLVPAASTLADSDPLQEHPSDVALDSLADPAATKSATATPPPSPSVPDLQEPLQDIHLELAQPAQVAENPVTGMRATLSVRPNDDAEPHCRYTWSVVSKPADAALPIFTINGSRNARETNVRFYRAGQYVMRVTVAMGEQTMTSDVAVQVEKKPG